MSAGLSFRSVCVLALEVMILTSCSFSSVCLALFWFVCHCFILFYYFTVEPDCFLTRERNSVDSDGKEEKQHLGRVGEGKTVIKT